jgi:hypothetical protein
VVQLKVVDHLNKEQRKQLERLKKLQNEKVDWLDIMGAKDRGLKRKKGGALTNK